MNFPVALVVMLSRTVIDRGPEQPNLELDSWDENVNADQTGCNVRWE